VSIRIGIDLGGTKIEGIALKSEGLEILRRRIPTPAGDYDATVRAVSELVDQIASEVNADGSVPVGIGIPGAISPKTGLIKNANSTCLIGHPLDRDLEDLMNRPVRLANDADCFTISETVDGAGIGVNTVFGVILGTGVGAGIATQGRLIQGRNAIAGEWGHNPLPWMQKLGDGHDERPGPDCYCGKSGCIETFLSGPGLARDHLLVNSVSLSSTEIVQRANARDQQCEDTMSRYEHRLARALAGVINILDPDVIVLGGGMSNIERLYVRVPELWQDWVFSDEVDTRLLKNKLGDSCGVRGAAWLWD
jgi:fructokinase